MDFAISTNALILGVVFDAVCFDASGNVNTPWRQLAYGISNILGVQPTCQQNAFVIRNPLGDAPIECSA